MKLNTFQVYDWTADLYIATENQQGQIEYLFDREISFAMSTGAVQTYLFSPEPIEWGGQLIQITNKTGQRPYFIYPDGPGEIGTDILMYINSSVPVIDIYGKVTGYQQTLLRTKPTNWESAVVSGE